MNCITGTLLNFVSLLQVLCNGMLIMNSFLITYLVCAKGEVVWKWMHRRHFPGDVLTVRGSSEMDRHSQMLRKINSLVTVLLLILNKSP